MREHWASKLGFILASAGSAIGLGNIWRFPYLVGQNGGAAFVLVYILFVILLGIPVMLAEFSIGQEAQKNPVGTFRELAGRHSHWQLVGFMGIGTGIIILAYYTGIAGWTLAYIVRSLNRTYYLQDAAAVFQNFISSPQETIFWLLVFAGLGAGIIVAGVTRGIERWCKYLLPILFGILLVLLVRSLTLPNAAAGLSYYLRPDFSKLSPSAILAAAGQAFFSLSLGMGVMITYGSYLGKDTNLLKSAIWVSALDTAVAFLAGMVIFPAVFAFGLEPNSGPGLTFITLPRVFAQMPMGNLFATLFFILLAIAALTSTISLLEVIVSFAIDELGWSRPKATIIMALGTAILGILPTLSFGVLSNWTIYTKNIFEAMDFLAANILLPSGGLLITIFVGWVWARRSEGKIKELNFLIKFIVPVIITTILVSGLLGSWKSLLAALLLGYGLLFLVTFYFYPLIWIGRDARQHDESPVLWRFLFLLFAWPALILYLIVRKRR